jgi:microcystin-dependent protein
MDGFIGEIRPIALNFVPENFVPCFGQTLPIQQYTALYAVIGRTYGPATSTTFTLPDLRGHAIMGQGTGPGLTARPAGQNGGTESVALTANQLPNHTHTFNGATGGVNARVRTPSTNTYLTNFGEGAGAAATTFTTVPGYVSTDPDNLLNPNVITQAGGGQAHENRQPYLAIIYCICVVGDFLPNPN